MRTHQLCGMIGLGLPAAAAVWMWGGPPETGQPDPAPAAAHDGKGQSEAKISVSNILLASVAFMPPLRFAGQEVSVIRVRGTAPGRGEVDLDPNPVVVDRFGEVTKQGLRAFTPGAVEFVEIGAAPGWKLYEIRPAKAWGAGADGSALSLAVGDGACGPHRLIVLDETGRVRRVVTLEPARP